MDQSPYGEKNLNYAHGTCKDALPHMVPDCSIFFLSSSPSPSFKTLFPQSPTLHEEEDDMYYSLSAVSLKPHCHALAKCTIPSPLLFKSACKHYRLSLNCSILSHGPVHKGYSDGYKIRNEFLKSKAMNGQDAPELLRRCILLDIEGTTTPISFVTDVLFPYARDNVRKHLTATYNTEETIDDIILLRAQVEDDLKQGFVDATPIPPEDAGKEEVISSLTANVEAMIRADRKITALKQLQGHIWRTGFQSNELEGVVFEDVPFALKKWQASGIKVYIYSSGSRLAQRLIFGNTNYGDLRKYLCGFFDTTIGNKKETQSYFEISQTMGVDSPSEVLFLTDVYQEAVAAKTAGLDVIISVRPGNAPLPENHGFKTIKSFSEIEIHSNLP